MRLSLALVVWLAGCTRGDPSSVTLLNVSFDPTRELYEELDAAFARDFAKKTGVTVTVNHSHGGSGKQARAVIEGLEADVVTLALGYDIDAIAAKGRLLPAEWAQRLPYRSAPFASTVVFVVRRGNPKGVRDWEDLARPGLEVITPNPKTSGGARWNYLAAYGHALRRFGGDDAAARALVRGLYANVPVLDAGARGSTTIFVERGLGDVLVTWESDALLVLSGPHGGELERVVPSTSVLAETPVAVVDKNVDRHGTRAAAEAYLQFFYSDEARAIAVRHGFRPNGPNVALPERFAKLELFGIDTFGGWARAQAEHFDASARFDSLAVKR